MFENIALRGESEIYNVATGVSISFMQLKILLENAYNCIVTFADEAEKRVTPIIDISKIVSKFGFNPRDVLDDIEETFMTKVRQSNE